MPRIFAPLLSAAVLLLLVAASPAPGQDLAERAAVVAPFLDDQTLAIGRLNVERIDPAALVKALSELLPANELAANQLIAEQLTQMEQGLHMVKTALRAAGIGEVYTVISLSDIPQGPPFLIAPVKAGSDVENAAKILRELTRLPAGEAIGGVAVVGSKESLARLKMLQPTPRPEFTKAFELAGDTTAQFIFSPTDDTRRVLREMLPRLPDEIGGGSGTIVADGLRWAVLSADAPPNLSLQLTVQSKDADAAAALRAMTVSLLQLASKQKEVATELPEFAQLVPLITPRVQGDQLLLELSAKDEKFDQVLRQLVVRPVQAARTAAGRHVSQNNLKQIAIAMHNYHDSYRRFPPQAIRSKPGKPLLSWRVAILPYLEQMPLYQQFKLDEPWDSEHNKALIEKMPAVFASQQLDGALRAKGLTSYLAPLSKQPQAIAIPPKEDPKAPMVSGKNQMIFDLPQGTAFSQITDGTSNTILVVEANSEAAVVWTRPDDLVLDESDLLESLAGQPSKGFNASFADGSVRFISESVDLKLLLRLLQMNDGQVTGEF
ncbi:MAG: DUF1559 domain-containing protein [Pirellulaceae bacterium]